MAFDLSLVTLGVEDLDRSIDFYTELGLPMADRDPADEIAFFDLGGPRLALYPRELLAEDVGVPAEGEGFAGVTLANNVGSEADVDATIEDAAAAGAEVVKPAEAADWGGYSGYIADPDGHLWEIAYNPFWDG